MQGTRRPGRWRILVVGLVGLIAGCATQYGLAYLIPALRADGLSLATATFLVTAPVAGVLAALIAWGAAADRWGERTVLTIGLAGGGAALLGAADPFLPFVAAAALPTADELPLG